MRAGAQHMEGKRMHQDFGTLEALEDLTTLGYLTEAEAKEVAAAIDDVSERYCAGLIGDDEADKAIEALARQKAEAWNARRLREAH